MAFVKADLEADLLDCFQAMEDGDNKKFSQDVSKAFKDFIETGTPVTVDTGSVSAGAFSGASTGGSLSADDTDCEDTIYKACLKMKDELTEGGNDYLAEKIAEGLQKMLDDVEVKTQVSGIATPPPPATPVSLSGSAKGGITCDTSTVESALKACFSAMIPMTAGGNAYMAGQCATCVDACLKAGAVSTDGEGSLAGSKGTGTVQ